MMQWLRVLLVTCAAWTRGAVEASGDTAVEVRSISLLQTQKATSKRLLDSEVVDANTSGGHNVTISSNMTKEVEGHFDLAGPVVELEHAWHELKDSSPVFGRWFQDSLARVAAVAHEEAAALPARKQILIVFMAVSATVSFSWMSIVVGVRLLGQESLRRLKLLILFASLCACSWGMTFANEHLMVTLRAPGIVTAVQCIIGVVVSIVLAGGRLSLESSQVLSWMVVPGVACLHFWTSLYTMEYFSLSTLMVFRHFGPILALQLETMVMPVDKHPMTGFTSILALFVVLASTVAYFGGMPSSWRGCMMAFLNTILTVVDALLRRRLLTKECAQMSEAMCLLLNNLIVILPSMLLCFCTGELLDVDAKVVFSADTAFVLIISGLVGAWMSYFALKLQREITATSFIVFENAIRLVEVTAGVLLFKDPLTWPAQLLGLTVSCCGSLWYAKEQSFGRDATGMKGKVKG